MELNFKTGFKKGEQLPISVEGDRIILHSTKSEHKADLTDLLDKETVINIKHVGGAIAVVSSQEKLNICYCIQFHVHSQFSILDGMSSLGDIAKKSSGITAVTDHGNMYAMLNFQMAMEKEGKIPLFGSEVYVETITGEREKNHLILIAKNETGKKNLIKLSSDSFNNIHYKPHVKFSELKENHEGLICTSACMGGELSKKLLVSYEEGKKVALEYQKIFGDDYYLEIQRHGIKNEDMVNKLIIQLSKELGIKLVASNDSHYIKREDKEVHEALLCVSTSSTLNNQHFAFEGDDYYYMTDSEMTNKFWDLPEAIANTLEIARKCDLKIETGVYHLPKYEVPEGFANETEYLIYLVNKGFNERFSGTEHLNDKVYIERLQYEVNVIIQMGFPAYFLIVWDYVNWAKTHDILVGPGRGSAAGSLVSYCLKITDLDPIKYGLYFERFLNPDRISMPDIDMDFEYSRRNKVKRYVQEKYGTDCVCDIITFGCMQSKQAVNDCARVLGKSTVGREISKLIPDKAKNLEDAVSLNPELGNLLKSDKDCEEIFSYAKRVEGNPRQTGIHACGVVVSDKPIKNYLPTAMVKDNRTGGNEMCLVSQVDKGNVEDMGLLKMDFLGLRALSPIEFALKTANEDRVRNGFEPFGSYREITITDPYVYSDISEGKSYAVFQLESAGMRNFMSDLFCDVKSRIALIENKYGIKGYKEYATVVNPSYDAEMTALGEELFERMIAGVSLYRPGPMDYIPDFIKGIKNPDSVVYDTPKLKPILQNTYGVIVYQEQVMEIVRELAGFTMGQSDTIRKAMGKKKKAILEEYKPYFIHGSGDAVDEHTGKPLNINGCMANGISEETAEAIWQKMNNFASYAFNKSHAAVYSVITMTCAYLKHYHKVGFMCGIINAFLDNANKLKSYISVALRMGIEILPPDINKSLKTFTVEGDAIRYGLCGLKGISKNADVIISEREKNGEYKGLQNFCDRLYDKKVNKKNLESLIFTGCLDTFVGTRRGKESVIEKALKSAKKNGADTSSSQLSFFEELKISREIEIPNIEEYPKEILLRKEKEFSGMYITEHPLDIYSNVLLANGVTDISTLIDEDGNMAEGKYTFAGIISDIHFRITKKDSRTMATFNVEDRTESINAVIFPNDFENYSHLLSEGNLIAVKGTVQNDDNFGPQLLVSSIALLKDLAEAKTVYGICVRLNSLSESDRFLEVISPYLGGNLRVYVQADKQLYEYNTLKVYENNSMFLALQDAFGVDNVKYLK